MASFFRNRLLSSEEFWLSGIAALIVLSAVVLSYRLHLVVYHSDAASNLNAARFALDGLTPGLSQIGAWNPLLRLLLIPAVFFPALYWTGLAGPVVVVPFAVIAVLFFYKTLKFLTEDVFLSCIGAFLFCLHPYFLYFSTTAMTEVPYLAMLTLVAYFFSRYLTLHRGVDMFLSALFVSLACLVRTEGLILFLIVSIILLCSYLFHGRAFGMRKKYVVWFFLFAGTGLLLLLCYGWIFSGDPFAFTLHRLNGFGIVERFHKLSKPWGRSLLVFLYASFVMHGKIATLFALVVTLYVPLVIACSRKRLATLASLCIFLLPALIVILIFKFGQRVMNVPPFGNYDNERYAFMWLGYVILTPILFFRSLRDVSRRCGETWRRLIYVLMLAMVVIFCGFFLKYTGDVVLGDHWLYSQLPLRYSHAAGQSLGRRYDYGKILISHGSNPFTVFSARIPLRNYIQEMNHPFFEEALAQPWLSARWIMLSSEVYAYAKALAPVEQLSQFEHYYEQVEKGEKWRLFRLREDTPAL